MKVKNNLLFKSIISTAFMAGIGLFIFTIYSFAIYATEYNALLMLLALSITVALGATLHGPIGFRFIWFKPLNKLLAYTKKIEIQWYYIILIGVGFLLVSLKIPTDWDMLLLFLTLLIYFLDIQEMEPLEIPPLREEDIKK